MDTSLNCINWKLSMSEKNMVLLKENKYVNITSHYVVWPIKNNQIFRSHQNDYLWLHRFLMYSFSYVFFLQIIIIVWWLKKCNLSVQHKLNDLYQSQYLLNLSGIFSAHTAFIESTMQSNCSSVKTSAITIYRKYSVFFAVFLCS